jgi:phosphohistidine phosphatase
MKTLILIRHAKSSWNDLGAHDFDRTLNHRGLDDAPMMGGRLVARLNDSGISLDAFVCSTARRAAQTAEMLAAQLQFPIESVDWRRALYLASPGTILDVIRSVPDEADTAALLAHNPGITELAEQLTGVYFGNVPTCGVMTLRLPIDLWVDAGGRAELIDFDFPKAPSR